MANMEIGIHHIVGVKMSEEIVRDSARIRRLKMGDWSFGHAGQHRGIGTDDCPKTLHHHHDQFCRMPNILELMAAGIHPNEFKVRSRA